MILGSELNNSNLYPMQINKKKQPWHYAPIFFHLRYADLILMQASWCFLQASIPVFIQSISSSTIQQGRTKNNQNRTSTVCRVLAKEMDTGAVQAQSKYILAPVCRWMESTSRNLSLTHGLRRSAIAAARRSLLVPKMWVRRQSSDYSRQETYSSPLADIRTRRPWCWAGPASLMGHRLWDRRWNIWRLDRKATGQMRDWRGKSFLPTLEDLVPHDQGIMHVMMSDI